MRDAILVQELSKQFYYYHGGKPLTLKETLLQGLRRAKSERFWALQDVSFSIAPGRMVGLIGRNGAGKSTLLRLIGGVGRPDRGRIKTYGRVGALLDLGAGFHPDLTGRENVFINGIIAGLTRREIKQQFEAIVAFAELEQFIDNPLRTYSTGMRMRLGFAIAVHTSPEILLIDEVLAVGDLAFQNKCLARIAQFKSAGCAIILVSHDESQIRQLCDEVVWLRAGRLVDHGTADAVVSRYVAEVMEETQRRTPEAQSVIRTSAGTELRLNENRFGSLELEITSVRLLTPKGLPVKEIDSGDPLQVEIEYLAPQPTSAPIFVVTIAREDQLICYDTSTAATGQSVPTLQGQGKIALHLERLDLNGGQYYVNVGIYHSDWAYAYDYHCQAYPLLVRQSGFEKGVLSPPHHWQMDKLQVSRLNR